MTWAALTFWQGLVIGFYVGALAGVALMCLMRAAATDSTGSDE